MEDQTKSEDGETKSGSKMEDAVSVEQVGCKDLSYHPVDFRIIDGINAIALVLKDGDAGEDLVKHIGPPCVLLINYDHHPMTQISTNHTTSPIT
jgi:hypothetical protein